MITYNQVKRMQSGLKALNHYVLISGNLEV